MDQANDKEKSWQVQMMDKIYSRADKTYIYLGPSSRFSDEAVRTFLAYGRRALQGDILGLHNSSDANDTLEFGYERWTWDPQDSQGGQLINEVIRKIETPGLPPLDMLESLMQRPWWSRIWVLQELLLSPNPIFVCGQQTMSARVFVASVRLYEAALTVYCERLLLKPHDGSFSQIYSKRMSNITRAFHNMADVPALVLYTTQLRQIARSRYHGIEEPYFGLGNLWDLVQDISTSAQRLDASDSRDRIYALIGIARLSRVDPVGILPDYTLSCTDVYAQATHFFMQYTGPCLLETAAFSRFRTSLSTLPSWAVDWSLSGLSVTPEPPTENPDPRQFEFSRHVSNKYILKSSVQKFGTVEIIDIEYPPLELFPRFLVNAPEEDALDTIARMSVYLSDASAYVSNRSPSTESQQNFLERLTHTMVLQSVPDHIDADSETYTLPEIRGAASILVEQMIIASSRERHFLEGPRDIAVKVLIHSSIGIGTQLVVSATPNLDDVNLYPESNPIIFVLQCLRKTVRKYTRPFIANGNLVGTGPRAMRNGDALIGYEKEGLRFAVRPVDGGLYELIGKAYVPQLDSEQAEVGRAEASMISLC